MTVTFVTAYYNLYETDPAKAKVHFRESAKYFLQLIHTGVFIVLCTDTHWANEMAIFLKENGFDFGQNLYIMLHDFVVPQEYLELPMYLNVLKDTLSFLVFSNCKTRFLKCAMERNPRPQNTHYAWIDFRIVELFSEAPATLGFLHYLGNQATIQNPCLVIPGCTPKKSDLTLDQIYNRVQWRFCGGFFLGDRQSCFDFHELYEKFYPTFAMKQCTWDINFWAWLEQEGHFSPLWYPADNNDSLVSHFPNICFAQNLQEKSRFQNLEKFLQVSCPTGFHPSSVAHIVHEGREWINVRAVNYHIDENHRYHIVGSKIMTLNMVCPWPLQTAARLVTTLDWTVEHQPCKDPMALGVEDLRLWHDAEGKVRFLATNWDHTVDNVCQIVAGHYNLEGVLMDRIEFVNKESTGRWEKNWAPLEGRFQYVYQWSVDSVYTGDFRSPSERVKVPFSQPNQLFRSVRGSSVFFPWLADESVFVGVVHYSEIFQGRKMYYHMLVQMDASSGRLLAHTDPFCFIKPQIEFCIGYHWNYTTQKHRFWVSINDDYPVYLESADLLFHWHKLP